MTTPFTVGIAGGSGSGKTYYITKVASFFNKSELCLVSMDHYYKPREEQATDEKGVKNFDLPSAVNHEAFLSDIRKLKNGGVVNKMEYTFNNPINTPKALIIEPAPVILIEGLFVQYFQEIENELDLKIFIEARDQLKLARRIKRDKEERGYDLDDVLYRYEHHTMPVYREYIAPLRHKADLVISNNSDFDPPIDFLVSYLRQILGGIVN
ncbi:MAG TPA: uridine kinase [Cyclobacteriaceae bacterium]